MKSVALSIAAGLFCFGGMIGLASAQYPSSPPGNSSKAQPKTSGDGVTITFRNPLDEKGGPAPKRPGAGVEGPKFTFGADKTKTVYGVEPLKPTLTTSPGGSYSSGSYGSKSSSSSSSTSTKVKVVYKKVTKITEEVEISIDSETVTVPDRICHCAPIRVRCDKNRGSTAYLRFSCGRTVVWFVVSPTKEDEPYTIYPPFVFRMNGNQPIAQEQDWLVEYVYVQDGRQTVIWESRMRILPDRAFQPRNLKAVFDVTRPFEKARVKACEPFILGVCQKQSWWGTNVPGYKNGGIQADVVAGWPLMLRFPYPGEAAFEDREHNILGPVIIEE